MKRFISSVTTFNCGSSFYGDCISGCKSFFRRTGKYSIRHAYTQVMKDFLSSRRCLNTLRCHLWFLYFFFAVDEYDRK